MISKFILSYVSLGMQFKNKDNEYAVVICNNLLIKIRQKLADIKSRTNFLVSKI